MSQNSPSKLHGAGTIPKGVGITPLGKCPECKMTFQSRVYAIPCELNYHLHCIAPGTPKATEEMCKTIRSVGKIIQCPSCTLKKENERERLIEEQARINEQLERDAKIIQQNKNALRRTEAEYEKIFRECELMGNELKKFTENVPATSTSSNALNDAMIQINMLNAQSAERDDQIQTIRKLHEKAKDEITSLNIKVADEEAKCLFAKTEMETMIAESTAQQMEIQELQNAKHASNSRVLRSGAKRTRVDRIDDDISDDGSDDSSLLAVLVANIDSLRISINKQGENLKELTTTFTVTTTTLMQKAIQNSLGQLAVQKMNSEQIIVENVLPSNADDLLKRDSSSTPSDK